MEFLKFLNSGRVASMESEVYITENTKRDKLFYSTLKTRMPFSRIYWHVGRSSEEI